MDKLENLRFKLEYAVAKGYTYNELTGDITTPKNKTVVRVDNGYIIINVIDINGNKANLKGIQLAWYIAKGEVVEKIEVINGIKTDMRIENLKVKDVKEIVDNDKPISSLLKKTIGDYRCKLGTYDRTKTTSAFVNIQARLTITNGMDIDSNIRRFRARLNTWLNQHTNNLFEGVKTSLIKSCDYTDSSRSHSKNHKTVLNFELTFLFDKPINYKKDFNKLESVGDGLVNFFDSYDEMKIEGSIK